MSINQSIIESVSPQKGGERYVTEAHTDHLGVTRRINALRDASVDDDAELARHAAQLVIDLAVGKQSANIEAIKRDGARATLCFDHAAAADMRPVLRDAWQQAGGQRCGLHRRLFGGAVRCRVAGHIRHHG